MSNKAYKPNIKLLLNFKIKIQLLLVLFPLFGISQTTIINPATDGGFQTGAATFAANNWTSAGGTNSQNRWIVGTGATAGFTGTRCAYITNTAGGAHDYTLSTSRASHFYRDVTIPVGETNIILNFSWMGQGESSFDKMRVWVIPTTVTPTYGTAITASGTAPTGNIQVGASDYSTQATWTSTTFNLPTAYAGTTVRLVFEWTNDSSLGTTPPAAIDNISLTSQVPAAPANNECLTATALTVNGTTTCTTSTNGNTNFATQSQSGCSGTADDDVWYTFVATSTNQIVTVTPTTLSDAVFQVFSGTCAALTSITCINNTTGSSAEVATLTGLTIGTTYRIRVYSNASGSDQGTFNICVTTPPTPPTNNLCANATALPCGTTNLAGTTVNTASIVHNSGCSMSDYGVWYTFVGDGNSTTITTNPSFDIKLSISTGTCASMSNIVCTDSSPETATFTTILGSTYYVYVAYWSSGGTTTGTFTISRSCVTCAPPTANAATNVTLTTATVSWTPPSYTPSNGYEYAITTSATPPGSGTSTALTSINATGLTANTVYYLHVRSNCGAVNGFSSWSTISFITGYCISNSSNSTYWISNFSTTLGTVNINRNSTYTAGGYANYSATDIVSKIIGQSFNFSTTMSSDSHGINIYVDWNNDLDFNDSGEKVYASGSYVASATGTITIPISTSIGNHRMRVVTNYNDSNPTPCGSNSYTETEDYTINVLAPPACSGTPTAGTVVVNPNTSWPGAAYVISATGFTVASNMTYQWQYSSNTGGPWTNAGAATSSYADYNATAPASGLVYWHLVVTCTNSSQSATSSNGIFTTMVVSDVLTGCPNVVSGGLGLNGADPAAITCNTASCVDLEANYLDLGNTTNYIVEAIQYNPPIAFNGLTNPVSVNIDDKWSPQVDLPFNFCFYGNTYNKCLIGSNGVVTFDLTNNTPGGTCDWEMYGSTGANLPISGHNALIENSIFGVFHDINPANGGQVGWQLITLPTGCRALVVSWYTVPMFSNDATNDYTGMMVLYENSNVIEVYVQKKRITTYAGSGVEGMWNDGNAVIGIQNATGTLASVPPGRNVLDPNWTSTNEAWRFVPSGTSIASIKWYEGAGVSGPVVGTTPTINVCPATTTIYTAEITYTLCNGATLKESDQTTVTVTANKTWNGTSGTNWNTAANWTPSGVPTATEGVLIPNTTNKPIVSGGATALACSLNIQSGGILTINPSNVIKVTNAVVVAAGGNMIIENTGSLVQVNNSVNTGNIQYKRTANVRRQDYVYWSSPVASFASTAVSPGTSLGYQYKWLPTTAAINNFGNWAFANEIMTIGKGYCLRAPDSYPLTTLTNYTATFVGVPNNGNLSFPISRGSYNGANYSTGVSTTPGTKDDDNWNLVGNPYPSAIHAVNFLTLNTNIAGFINVWTHGTLPSAAAPDPFYNNYVYNYTPTDYLAYNSVGASSGAGTFNGRIAGGQAFFISMLHTSAAATENLNFNNSLRSETYDNSVFYKNSNNNKDADELEKHRIWFDLVTTSGNSTRSLLGYVENATNQSDRLFDAFTSEKLTFNIFSLINDEQMLIQGRQLPFDINDKVKIGVSIPQDGLYKIALSNVDGLFLDPKQNIYLEDKLLNVIFNLKDAPYSFIDKKGIIKDRFILRYTKSDQIKEVVNQLNVYDNNTLTVESGKLKIKDILVFDTLGKLLLNKNNVNNTNYQITNLSRTNSMLIVKVTLEDNTEEVRKIIY